MLHTSNLLVALIFDPHERQPPFAFRPSQKDLPKYNDALSKKLKEWENECGEPFMFKGERYADIMSVQESEWRAYKDNEAAKKLQTKQQEKARYSGVGGKPKMMTKKKNPLGSSRQNSIS